MKDYPGSCLCGAVTFSIHGSFDSFYLCHCRHCQKDTGSAHAANLFSGSATLAWQSGEDAVTTFTLPGTRHGKSFCQRCGSPVPNNLLGDTLVIPAGCLDSDVPIAPTAHIFTCSRANWDKELEAVPGHEGLPE